MILRLDRGEGRVAFGWRRETSVEEKYRERERGKSWRKLWRKGVINVKKEMEDRRVERVRGFGINSL